MINSFNELIRNDKGIQSQKKKNITIRSPRLYTSPVKAVDNYKVVPCRQSSVKNQSLQTRPEQRENQPGQRKLLPIILKQIVYESYLRKPFCLISNKVQVKKISFQLLKDKQRKHVQQSLLTIKIAVLSQKLQKWGNKVQQHKNSNLIGIILGKIMKNKNKQSFQAIKKKHSRDLLLSSFVLKLQQCTGQFVNREIYQLFLSKLRSNNLLTNCRHRYLHKMVFLNRKRIHRLLQSGFNKIVNFSIFMRYELRGQERRQKNKEVISLNSSRKTIINGQKQKLRKLKHSFDSINLQKNRSLNQLKKSRTIIKQQMNIDVRSLQAQCRDLEDELSGTKQLLQQSLMSLQLRQKSKRNALQNNYVEEVMVLYEKIQNEKNQEVKVSQNIVLSQLIEGEQMVKFQNQSAEFYFLENLQLLQLIYQYEKAKSSQTNELSQDYLEKLRESQQLKRMVGLLVSRQVQKGVHGSIIKFSKEMQTDSSFSPVKADKSNLYKQMSSDETSSVKQESFLPYSFKNSKKSSNLEDPPARTIGKISSRAHYFNN